jgi:ParB-like chromosome segregation protein Spo0J
MKIEKWNIERITPYARNARKIGQPAIDKVAASLKEFGWRQPIVVDPQGVVIAGHTRLLAAQKLGVAQVPVHVARDLTPAQVKAYRLTDNRTNQETDWDFDLLALEFEDLRGLEFDLALTGFSDSELQNISAAEDDPDLPADTPEEDEAGDTSFTVGSYRGQIKRNEFLLWEERIRQEVGFDAPSVVGEIRRRLGL